MLRGHAAPILSLSFASPDGNTVASGSGDGTTRLWDSTTGRCLKRIEGMSDANAAFSGADPGPGLDRLPLRVPLACVPDAEERSVRVQLRLGAADRSSSVLLLPGMEPHMVFASAGAPPRDGGGDSPGPTVVGATADAAEARAPLLFVFLKGSADGQVMRFRAVP